MARPSSKAKETPELALFGEGVRRERMNLGLSQEAFADLAGLDRSYMGGVERGEHNIALINQFKIAKALGIKLSDLLALSNL